MNDLKILNSILSNWKFGTVIQVEEAMLMFDRQTNRHRGFGFVTFDSEDAVENVVEIHYHEINNKTVCTCLITVAPAGSTLSGAHS